MRPGRRRSASRGADGRPTPVARASATDATDRPRAADRQAARPAILAGLVGLVVAGAIGAALFGLPVRTWFGQDDELQRLEVELSELQSVNADLQNEVDRLQTAAGIIEAARESSV